MFPGPLSKIQDADTARQLAEYYDDLAKQMRAHADSLSDTNTRALKRAMNTARAGRIAHALIKNGEPRAQAIARAAIECQTSKETVAARLERLEKRLEEKHADRLKQRIAALRLNRHSWRDIESKTGVPRATAQRWFTIWTQSEPPQARQLRELPTR